MHVGVVATPTLLVTLLEVTLQILKELLTPAFVEAGVGMTVPVAYHQIAEKHTAQVSRMGYTIT